MIHKISMNTWNFVASGNEELAIGDILIFPNEQIVGYMLDEWPTAVTKNVGGLYSKPEGYTWSELDSDHAKEALEIARKLGYEVNEDGSF